MDYHFSRIEKKWQQIWEQTEAYKSIEDDTRPKCYVLDMFPYPSGAGLHVGHPLGYVASDVYARYKRLRGFNVLHPIGFDAFGLPAEQFALQTGKHPAQSTRENIANFTRQLKSLALSYDWSREVLTCDPKYYRWTQWIFLRIFESWFNPTTQKAEPISNLREIFTREGNQNVAFPNPESAQLTGIKKLQFSADEWNAASDYERKNILMQYRLAYLADTQVNWCEALGTVLANDEVINGLSYRGGHPVTKRKMRQWNLRISAYAERLLEGLTRIDFSTAMKDIQKNWIGRSEGAYIRFKIADTNTEMSVFTTRPDTIFGVDFMVLAPEHALCEKIVTADRRADFESYLTYVQSLSEVARIMGKKTPTGIFTGAYAVHPITQKKVPIWVSEYVLVSYATGAIMGVASDDERDRTFAEHFRIPITEIINRETNTLTNSDFLDRLTIEKAKEKIIDYVETHGIGERSVQYKMRDAGWSRQRYWGEPFPITFDADGMPEAMKDDELPLTLPDTDNFTPAKNGEGPLAHCTEWLHDSQGRRRDTNTMPTHAGAAWYFMRYADPHNAHAFADPKKLQYWSAVDVYIGGSEHAVSHLLYARLWTKILFDLGYVPFDEPFQKLINQGKITGTSAFVYRKRGTNIFVSQGLLDAHECDPLHVDISLVKNKMLDTEAFKKWLPEFADATFLCEENGQYICGEAVEKMSKSKFNVVNPDDIIARYGTDTFRLYELFLGPLEQSKPWNTQGIEGVHRFLKKLWALFFNHEKFYISTDTPNKNELKSLHKCIEKIARDVENFSFNTAVSAFMICVNELGELNCHKREILLPLLVLLCPFAPHIAEELWEMAGKKSSILCAPYPIFNSDYTRENSKLYPISVNGKTRTQIDIPLGASEEKVREIVLADRVVQKWAPAEKVKKIIYVRGKIINIIA